MKRVSSFYAIFSYAPDGISIEFPDLPGCLSCADSTEEGDLIKQNCNTA